ncbi:hypothetical protein [Acaryochloris marina]|uniref:Uncharacterized protein n=1 Tax=Acaryochloris marina (strain MBIC 11017) TaxID=329726 RepID=B0CFN3_ACAM1|nr:hypothetical protein [Acaryochloris marina]ABW27052.1 hypothetical protein AM1_2037 [Acaryochloris marina MBIC11017]BDM81815.1 hypothetical protein AM10699_46810 [Acaryochloris marina MBIC10699]
MQERTKLSICISILRWLIFVYFGAVGLWRLQRFLPLTESSSTDPSCRQAILQGEEQINQLPQVKLQKGYWDKVGFMYDPPAGRPQKYQYILEKTSGIRNVFSSPQFMSKISQNIMDNCSDVSMVGFSDARFVADINYGFFAQNAVKKVCRPDPLFFVSIHITYPFGVRNWSHDGCN